MSAERPSAWIPIAVGLGLLCLMVASPFVLRNAESTLVRYGFWLFPGVAGIGWAAVNHYRSNDVGIGVLVTAMLAFAAIGYGIWIGVFGFLYVAMFLITAPAFATGSFSALGFFQDFYLSWWALLTVLALLLTFGPTRRTGRLLALRLFVPGNEGGPVGTWIAATMPWIIPLAAFFARTRPFARNNLPAAMISGLIAGLCGVLSAPGADPVGYLVLSLIFGPLAVLVIGPLLLTFQFVATDGTSRVWNIVYLEVMVALPFLVYGFFWAMGIPAG